MYFPSNAFQGKFVTMSINGKLVSLAINRKYPVIKKKNTKLSCYTFLSECSEAKAYSSLLKRQINDLLKIN